MRQTLKILLLPSLLALALTSCRFFNLHLPGRLNLEIVASDPSLYGYNATITAEGPDRQKLKSVHQDWGLVSFDGLNSGYWTFTVMIWDGDEDEDGEEELLAFGAQVVEVREEKTTSSTIAVSDATDQSLLIAIEDLPAYVGVGQEYVAKGHVTGGSGDYEYYWYRDGSLIGSGPTVDIAGTLVLGDFVLELFVTDTNTSQTGLFPFPYTVHSPYEAIEITESDFTLSWTAPLEGEEIVLYRVFYREHGTFRWEYLSEVRATHTLELTIDPFSTNLGPGRWDFGVTSIDRNGGESTMHSCLDNTASPGTGWYLDWRI